MRGICELVLEARDLERLERFYLGLGLTPLSRDSDRVWLAAGAASPANATKASVSMETLLMAPPGSMTDRYLKLPAPPP